jgi:hypothetical protein
LGLQPHFENSCCHLSTSTILTSCRVGEICTIWRERRTWMEIEKEVQQRESSTYCLVSVLIYIISCYCPTRCRLRLMVAPCWVFL